MDSEDAGLGDQYLYCQMFEIVNIISLESAVKYFSYTVKTVNVFVDKIDILCVLEARNEIFF